jgi:hypothetical protein
LVTRWKGERTDQDIWGTIHWGKILLTLAVFSVPSGAHRKRGRV